MNVTVLAKSYAHIKARSVTRRLAKAINALPIGRVDVLHIKLYGNKPAAVGVTLQIEVGLGDQEPDGSTEQTVAERLRRIVRRVTGDAKSEAQAVILDDCTWYDTGEETDQ